MDLSTKTNDALFDRLEQLRVTIEGIERPRGEPVEVAFGKLFEAQREIALIHVELAKRTATGWRPL